MAKKAKAKASKSKAAATDTPTDDRKKTSAAKLRDLRTAGRAAQNDISEIAGGLGSTIKEAVEKNHLHRKAFAVIKAGDKMEPEKLAEYLYHLDYYLEASGLRARAATAPAMIPHDDEAEEPQTNVRPFPMPAGIAAE